MRLALHHNRLSADPTVLTLVLSLAIILIVGVVRGPEGHGGELTREKFWRMKVDGPARYEVVAAGDSRVLCDISPKAMSHVMGRATYNFGFNFAGYESEYLDAIEKKVDFAAQKPTIVLGITPRSLTPLNMRMSGFLEEKNRTREEKLIQSYLSDFTAFFAPIMLGTIGARLAGRTTERNFYVDGLMTVDVNPPDDDLDLRTYKKIFVDNRVSERHVLDLLYRVSAWKQKGVLVYGFRPPVARNIYIAEETMSGFEEKGFVSAFERAGGIWLTVGSEGLTFADGSHIAAKDVDRFSRLLALRMKEKEGSGLQ